MIRQNLSNPQPGAALYALNLLAVAARRALAQALPQLLGHPSAPVRLEALRHLERVGDEDALPLLRHRLATDTDLAVRHAAAAQQPTSTLWRRWRSGAWRYPANSSKWVAPPSVARVRKAISMRSWPLGRR